jgi:hypothetical protein
LPYDPEKNDVWSMGVLWYQLLHGTFPWKELAITEQELIYAIAIMIPTFSKEIPMPF